MKRCCFINKKGFTLIELIVAIGIVGIVLTAITSFLLTNTKAFNYADDQIQAQYQAQAAVNAVIDKAIGTKGVKDRDFDKELIIFTIDNSKYLFIHYDNTSNTLQYEIETSLTENSDDYKTIATNISSFELSPLPDPGVTPLTASHFQAAVGLQVKVTSTFGNSSVTINNQFYFRNKN